MKKLIVFAALALCSPAVAQTEKRVDSRIENVTVFLNRAQIKRSGAARIDGGRSTLIIGGLTSRLDPPGVRLSGTARFTIPGVSHRQNFLNEFTLPARLRVLKDSVQL